MRYTDGAASSPLKGLEVEVNASYQGRSGYQSQASSTCFNIPVNFDPQHRVKPGKGWVVRAAGASAQYWVLR